VQDSLPLQKAQAYKMPALITYFVAFLIFSISLTIS
jgi:hypothetical protein